MTTDDPTEWSFMSRKERIGDFNTPVTRHSELRKKVRQLGLCFCKCDGYLPCDSCTVIDRIFGYVLKEEGDVNG